VDVTLGGFPEGDHARIETMIECPESDKVQGGSWLDVQSVLHHGGEVHSTDRVDELLGLLGGFSSVAAVAVGFSSVAAVAVGSDGPRVLLGDRVQWHCKYGKKL
jgi:hypothetical protein